MGNLILRLQGPASRSSRSASSPRGAAPVQYSYNRSSAALELQDAPSPEPRFVPPPSPPRARAALVPRGNTMFLGLDQRIRGRSRGSTVLSVSVHVAIIAAVLWLAMVIHNPTVDSSQVVTPIQFTLYDPPPPPVMPVAKVRGGGGGGGAHQLVAPVQASLPKVVQRAPVIPLEAPKINTPKLLLQPATTVQLPQNNPMPKLGAPHTEQVAMASQGGGSANGFGFGIGGGVGSGQGTGQGEGSTSGFGGGIMSVGGGVSAPEVIHSVQPQFTAQARSQNLQGVVAVQLIVDSQGFPQDVHVVRSLGMGLDQEAIAAVKQYRFKPAKYQGRSVSVQMVIDVDFRLD